MHCNGVDYNFRSSQGPCEKGSLESEFCRMCVRVLRLNTWNTSLESGWLSFAYITPSRIFKIFKQLKKYMLSKLFSEKFHLCIYVMMPFRKPLILKCIFEVF